MYADDIIIMSKTENGLQSALNSLGNYCHKWKFQVNFEKSKVMVFQKKRKESHSYNFSLLNTHISVAKEYKYLGIYVADSGKLMFDHLISKAAKAMFAIRKRISNIELLPKIQIYLFKTFAMPIILYASEVWGSCMIGPRCKSFISLFRKIVKSKIEKLYMTVARQILGVNKKTSHCAIRGEFGIYPIGFTIIENIFKYFIHSKQQNQNPLLREAFELNWKNNGFDCNIVKKICHLGNYNLPNDKQDVKHIISEIKKLYEDEWLNTLMKQSNNKLRTYNKSKYNFRFENYLNDIRNLKYRQALTRLRVSSHNLRIETGRFHKKNNYLPPKERVCQMCDISETEDESHFLLTCNLYSDIRKQLWDSLEVHCPNFNQYLVSSKQHQLTYLLSSEGPICKSLGKYCYLAFRRRNEFIYETKLDEEYLQPATSRHGRKIKRPVRLDL